MTCFYLLKYHLWQLLLHSSFCVVGEFQSAQFLTTCKFSPVRQCDEWLDKQLIKDREWIREVKWTLHKTGDIRFIKLQEKNAKVVIRPLRNSFFCCLDDNGEPISYDMWKWLILIWWSKFTVKKHTKIASWYSLWMCLGLYCMKLSPLDLDS